MPIAQSLLHDDWYKATMRAAVLQFFGDVQVTSAFTNRNTDFPVAKYIDLAELRDEFAALSELRYSRREIDFYASQGVLSNLFLGSLRDYRVPDIHVDHAPNDQLMIEVGGNWAQGMPAEVHALGIITELVSRKLAEEMGFSPLDIRRQGHRHLDEAIEFFRSRPHLKFAPFGARRHFSQEWEYEATAKLVEALPDQIAGISNVALAREFDFPLSGTIAHEMFIVPTMIEIARGNPNAIADAQNMVMDFWEALYLGMWNNGMLCTIPDTFGTESFLRHFTPERAENWRTHKQDSGPPELFVDRFMEWFAAHDIDPRLHRINHTDGLDLPKIAAVDDYCRDRYMMGLGWGTLTTNNVGVPTHSFVWKPKWVWVDGERVGCGKITDNLDKATGDPDMIQTLMRLTGYTDTFRDLQNV